jgi:peptidoglycan hydrolase CwlO-like protein
MKLISITVLLFVVINSIAQSTPTENKLDSLQQKLQQLQQKVDAQQEQLLDLKYENKLLRKEASNNNLLRRGFGNRSRVIVDRRGSKQAYVVYY